MNKTIKIILGVILFLSTSSAPQAQSYELKETNEFNWGKYIPSDLQRIIDTESKEFNLSPKDKLTINTAAANTSYRVRMTYLDDFRKISDDKKLLITTYVRSLRIDEKIINLFDHEMLFKHGSTLFWFPIQSQLLPHFKKELKKGDEVILFTMFLGTVMESNQIQWVFIVNEFQKDK